MLKRIEIFTGEKQMRTIVSVLIGIVTAMMWMPVIENGVLNIRNTVALALLITIANLVMSHRKEGK